MTDAARTDAPAPPAGNPARRRRLFILLGVAVATAAIVWLAMLLLAPPQEETDDAYVAGDVIAVTARDPGTVTAIFADDTQTVKAGQPLLDLDPATADIEVAAAEAELARAVRSFRSASSVAAGGDAMVGKAQAELASARNDLARRRAAIAEGAISGEELAHAEDAARVAAAALRSAESQQAEARAAIQGTDARTNPAVLAAVARLRRAAITRGHMHVAAPADGIVAQRRVQIGQQVAAGTPLMAVVPLNKLWVDANFRETQLRGIRIGQPATITSDTYGGKVVYHGRVTGLAAGSGNAFALLPPQNASGNWIKIVQRVPVRISLDPRELDRMPLRIGLSVKVEVDTADTSGTLLGSPAKPLYSQRGDEMGTAKVDARIAEIIAANLGRTR